MAPCQIQQPSVFLTLLQNRVDVSRGFMGRKEFAWRMRRLYELALRLSVARNLVKTVKADPMVEPFLVPSKTGRFSKFRRGADSAVALPGPVAKQEKWAGISIARTSAAPLEDVAHEYGHVRDASGMLRDQRRVDRLAEAKTPAKTNRQAAMQIHRARLSRTITRERIASTNAVEALKTAGANPTEVAGYSKATEPAMRRGQTIPGFETVNASYYDAYRKSKMHDPRQRAGGHLAIRAASIPL